MSAYWLLIAVLFTDNSLIENPISLEPSFEMVFEENLTVTSEDDDRAFFGGRPLDLNVDSHGNMYVTHGLANQIIVFDPQGQIKTLLGRKGQGPGEFENLCGFKVLNDGTAIAIESANYLTTLHRYDKNLQFVDSEKIPSSFNLHNWFSSPDGQYFAGLLNRSDEKGESNKFGIVNRKMEEVFIAHQYELPAVTNWEIDKPEFWLKFIPSRLSVQAQGKVPLITMDQEGNLFSALEHTYQITKWSPEGQKLMTFSKEYRPKYQSDEDIQAIVAPLKESLESQVPMVREMFTASFLDKAIKKSGFKNATHPVQGLLVTDQGHILVIHEHSFFTRKASADVFDAKGVFLGRAAMTDNGFRIMTFKDGQAYSLSQNEDDEWYLVRYKYSLKKL